MSAKALIACVYQKSKSLQRAGGGIYSSETSQCPATSEQAAAAIYGSAHRQMLRAGLGCAFKRSDV